MIIFDTETTGLKAADAAPLTKQPYIIEFAAIKLDNETLEEIDRIEFLCKPPIELPPLITQITGIRQEDLQNEKPFKAYYQDLIKFFFGDYHMVAHKVDFDRDLLKFELMRIGKLLKFPWPTVHTCTIEKSMSLKNRQLKLQVLYKELFDEEFTEAHRAMKDVEALTRCVIELRKRELL